MTYAVRVRHGPFGRVALLDLDRSLVTHAHPQCHLLLHVGGEPSRFGVRGLTCRLDAGHAVFVAAWEPHHYPHGEAGRRSTILAIYLEPGWLDARAPGRWTRLPGQNVAVGPAARAWVELVHREVLDSRRDDPALIAHALPELLGALFSEDQGVEREENFGATVDRRVRRALELMRSRLEDREDLTRLARDAGLSRPHLFELFLRRPATALLRAHGPRPRLVSHGALYRGPCRAAHAHLRGGASAAGGADARGSVYKVN